MATRKTYQPWSEEEEAKLAELVKAGWSSKRIAQQLDRPRASIDTKRSSMGISYDPATRPVNAEEDHAERVKHLTKMLDDLAEKQKRICGSQYRLNLPKARKPPTRGGYLRVIAGDLHGQQMDPAAFGAFVRDLKAINPREIIILGDWIDCGGWLSEHPTLHMGETEGSFADDILAGNQSLDAIQDAAPNARIEYLEGNHEWRIIKTLLKMTRGNQADANWLKKSFGVKALLNLEERGIEFYRHDVQHDGLAIRGTIKRGDWLFTHGPFKSAGKTAPDRNLMRLKGNFCQGHIHRMLHATQQSANDQTLHAYSFGCLCKMMPLWMANSPTDWAHGYGLQEVAKDGTAATYPIEIRDGASRLSVLLKLMRVNAA